MKFYLSLLTDRPASEPGALAHKGAECSCGTIIRSTLPLEAKKFHAEHVAWHTARGETVIIGRKPVAITVELINGLAEHPDHEGWGYLGHYSRTDRTDRVLAAVATECGLTIDDVFLWANSRSARHFMDNRAGANLEARLTTALLRDLPGLRAEVAS